MIVLMKVGRPEWLASTVILAKIAVKAARISEKERRQRSPEAWRGKRSVGRVNCA